MPISWHQICSLPDKFAVVHSSLVEVAAGVEVVAIITKDSVDNLGLAEGKEVYAVVKASDVMVAID